MNVKYEGESRGIQFYIVERKEICPDCKGEKQKKYKNYEDLCILCEGKGFVLKSDRAEVKTEEGITRIDCGCKHHSTKVFNPEAECSTKNAIIIYIYNQVKNGSSNPGKAN